MNLKPKTCARCDKRSQNLFLDMEQKRKEFPVVEWICKECWLKD